VLLSATTLRLSTGERIVLRSPLGPDAATLLAFVRALTRESWRNLNHPPSFFDPMDDDKERAFLEAAAAHPTSFLLTAFCEGVAIGNVGTIPAVGSFGAHSAEIGGGVLAKWHGRGLGRALFGRLVHEASRVGLVHLTLRVRSFNAPAIALYESLGFERVGTLKGAAKLPGEGFVDEHVYQRFDART
jgi:RimJ/RimL family protein N-acetyltransferase